MSDAIGFSVTKAIAIRGAHIISNSYYSINNNRHTYIIMYYLRNITTIYIYYILYRELYHILYRIPSYIYIYIYYYIYIIQVLYHRRSITYT